MRLVGSPVDDTITYSYIGCPSGCVIDSNTDSSEVFIPEATSKIIIT